MIEFKIFLSLSSCHRRSRVLLQSCTLISEPPKEKRMYDEEFVVPEFVINDEDKGG